MSTYIEPMFVILGFNQQDAQSHYSLVVQEEPERIFGHRVRIVPCSNPQSIEGLRVYDFAVSPLSRRHKGFARAHDALEAAVLRTNPKNGDQ